MRFYPVFLNLQGRPCVVVGGGPIAEGKVRGLLDAGAMVTVIAPEHTPHLQRLADDAQITIFKRRYQPGDAAGAFLVISAADDPSINEQVWREAAARSILVNVVDDAAHCGFIAPSILRRGDLTIAVSTSGRAPALAARLRERLEQLIGGEYGRFLELAAELREPLSTHYPDFEQRKALWYRLVDSDVLDLLRRGDEAAARRRIGEIVGNPFDEPNDKCHLTQPECKWYKNAQPHRFR